MEFRRIHDLPPYVFATVDQLKRELRRDGRDVIDLGFGNPDIPSPQIAVEKLCEAAAKPTNHRYSASRGLPNLRAGGLRALREGLRRAARPRPHVVSTIGAKEGLAHLMWVLLEPGDSAVVPSPAYPIHLVAPRLAGATVSTRGSRTATCSRASRRRSTRPSPSPRVVIASFPHNPTTAIATPELMQRLVDLAREHEFVLVHDFAYADIAFDGHVPPSVLAGRGRARLRRRAVLPDQVLLDGRLAHGLHARPPDVVAALAKLKSYLDYGTFQPIQIASIVALREAADYPAEVCEIYRGRRDALCSRPRPRRLARRAAARDDVRLGADPGAARRARLARVRAQARPRG